MNSPFCKHTYPIFHSKCGWLLLLLIVAWPTKALAQFDFTTNDNTITITQYTGSGGDVVIPDTINGLPVATIASDAFYQIEDLTSVTMGTNLTTIGTNAFFNCPNLSSVSFTGSVTNIGAGPFVDCLSLTVISMTSTNSHYIVTNGLLFNRSMTSLIEFPGGVGGTYTVPANVTNIGEAFIGNSLTAISAASANDYFSSANGVLFDKNQGALLAYPGGLSGPYTVPSTVTTVESASFEYGVGVTSVTMGTSVTTIGLFAFYDCPSLTAITVNAANTHYKSTNGVLYDEKESMLIQYPSGLAGNFIIPGTVTNIGEGAFGDAFGLTSVVIPGSVIDIGEEAFYSCESLTNMTIGYGVSNIGEAACLYCLGLTSLVIPGSITNIGFEAFAGCENLTNACFEGNEPTDDGGIFDAAYSLAAILYVNGTSGWGAYYDGIPTTPCAMCAGSLPQLAIAQSGGNVILTWSADFTGFALQSSTNLVSTAVWGSVSPSPTVVNGQNTVTNPSTGMQRFYRLMQ
jgi:hypothetical protein